MKQNFSKNLIRLLKMMKILRKIFIPTYLLYTDELKNINRSSTFYIFNCLLQLTHGDIADIRYFAWSAVVSKYCLSIANLLTSKIYTYPMKNRSLFKKKKKT